jgi:hypothetical protein
MKRKNQIRKLIASKFKLEPYPTSTLLKKFQMTLNRFNQIIYNKSAREMDAIEIKNFAKWLEVPESDLFESKKPLLIDLKSKYNLEK